MNYNQARNFVYKNARPLDLARWKYLFEGGSNDIPQELEQSRFILSLEDQTFGHGLATGIFLGMRRVLELYKPLLVKESIIDGVYDEDLYQELCMTLLHCIRVFKV